MFAADRRTMGEMPAQDHRQATDLAKLNVIRMYRVEDRDVLGRWIAEGKEGSSSPQNSVGTLAGAVLVPHKDGAGRLEPFWSLALPAVPLGATTPFVLASGTATTTAGTRTGAGRPVRIAAVRDGGQLEDDRLEPLETQTWRFHSGIPRGLPGVVIAGTEERKEERIFLPASIPLMSVQYGSPAQLSSVVYEAAGGAVDPNNASDLNTLVRIAALPQTLDGAGTAKGGGPKRGVLCWQLGEARTAASHGPCFQEQGASQGQAGRRHGGFAGNLRGGPFNLLDALDAHLLGLTARREKVFPVGLDIKAFWRDGRGHDAPLDFEQEPYSNPPPRPLRSPCHIRHNARRDHDWVGGVGPGYWQIEAEVPYMEPEDGFKEEVIFRELGAVLVGQADGAKREALLGSTERVTTYPGATRQGAALRFRAAAWRDGQPSAATGGAIDRELREKIAKAPDTAALVAVAPSDGTWDGFENVRDWSDTAQALADGGVMLLPAGQSTPEGVAEVLAGKFETIGDDREPDAVARLLMPEKLAGIDFGTIRGGFVEGSGVTRKVSGAGVRLRTSNRASPFFRGVEFAGLDADGVPTGDVPLAVTSTNTLYVLDNGTNRQALSTAGLTGNRTQTFQNRSGTLAHFDQIDLGAITTQAEVVASGGTTTCAAQTRYIALGHDTNGQSYTLPEIGVDIDDGQAVEIKDAENEFGTNSAEIGCSGTDELGYDSGVQAESLDGTEQNVNRVYIAVVTRQAGKANYWIRR